MRVGGDEIIRTAVQVGKVAAAASGDQDFLADTLRPLQHGHASPAPSGFNGAHQAGCSTAENDYVKTLHRKARKTLYRKGREGRKASGEPALRYIVTIHRPLRPSTSEITV